MEGREMRTIMTQFHISRGIGPRWQAEAKNE